LGRPIFSFQLFFDPVGATTHNKKIEINFRQTTQSIKGLTTQQLK